MDIFFFESQSRSAIKSHPVKDFLHCGVVEQASHESYQALTPFTDSSNMLMSVLGDCYNRHMGFGLRPEVVLYTILSQVAMATLNDPERFRSLYTTAPDKKTLVLVDNNLRLGVPSGWDKALLGMADLLRAAIPSGMKDMADTSSLSTCGPLEQIAMNVALMSASSPYYELKFRTLCGIPRIKLHGTVSDWDSIYVKTQALQQLLVPLDPTLKPWFEGVLSILTRIRQTLEGADQRSFWEEIYKIRGGSGGDKITGWFLQLYLFQMQKDYRTGAVSVVRRAGDWCTQDQIVSSISRVDCVWDYFGTQYKMEILGGVLTSEVVETCHTPRMGWAMAHK